MLKNTSHNSHILTLDGDFKCGFQEHEKEKVDHICLYNKCTVETRLCCTKCKHKYHNQHINSIVPIVQFSSEISNKSHTLLQKFQHILDSGETQQIVTERIERNIDNKLETFTKKFEKFLKNMKSKISKNINSKSYQIKSENLGLMSEIEDFNLILKKILSKSWKFQTKDDIELMMQIQTKDMLVEYLNQGQQDIERNIYIKTLNENFSSFLNKVQLQLEKLVNDTNNELNINDDVTSEAGSTTRLKNKSPQPKSKLVLKRTPPKNSTTQKPQKIEKTVNSSENSRPLQTDKKLLIRKKQSLSHQVFAQEPKISNTKQTFNQKQNVTQVNSNHNVVQINKKTNSKGANMPMGKNILVMGFENYQSVFPEILDKKPTNNSIIGSNNSGQNFNTTQNSQGQKTKFGTKNYNSKYLVKDKKFHHSESHDIDSSFNELQKSKGPYKNIVFESSPDETQIKNSPKFQQQTQKKLNSQPDTQQKTAKKQQQQVVQEKPAQQEEKSQLTQEQKNALKKWLYFKRIKTQDPQKVVKYPPKESIWKPTNDTSYQQQLLTDITKKYGKFKCFKLQHIKIDIPKENKMGNSDSSNDNIEVQVSDSDEEIKLQKISISKIPKVFEDCVELDTLRDLQGNIYDGEWKDGKREGRGILFTSDGSIYQGHFQNDKANNYGRIIHSNGNVYEGFWKDGQAHGVGKFVYNGNDKSKMSVYSGEFSNGKRHGTGHFVWADGSYYKGQFKDNFIEGTGLYCWKDGKSYNGKWIKGKMHGAGKFKWPDGKIYQGEFKEDKKIGFGKMEWPDKNKAYQGQWDNDQPHGIGEIIQNNQTKKGEWLNGKQIRVIDG